MESQQNECAICYEAVVDYPSENATGSYRSSCGHIFHPKCIATWHVGQDKSTCPMCRKVATYFEDTFVNLESESEDDEDMLDVPDIQIQGGTIRISRSAMECLLPNGVTPGVEAEIAFDEYNEIEITRYELQRIILEQGGNVVSDQRWNEFTQIYPSHRSTTGDALGGDDTHSLDDDLRSIGMILVNLRRQDINC